MDLGCGKTERLSERERDCEGETERERGREGRTMGWDGFRWGRSRWILGMDPIEGIDGTPKGRQGASIDHLFVRGEKRVRTYERCSLSSS